MKRIRESNNAQRWPRHKSPTIECRSRDLVFRITDWTRDRDEPAYDVETYIGGVYDWNESECHTLREHKTKADAKAAAAAFVLAQTTKLL